MQDMSKKFAVLLVLVVLIVNQSFADLLGNVLQISKPLINTVVLNKASKLSLLNILSSTLLKTPDGESISEGDIVIPNKLIRKTLTKEDGDLWPNGIVPYKFHKSVDKDHKELISVAIKHWQQNTCLRFRRKTPKDSNFIRFRTDTSGCWSSVGRQFDREGPQDISLGSGCFKIYTAIHEIGHSIGYYHEHARRDRDQFIEILWNNIKPAMDVQFKVKQTRNEGDKYDYRSVMHYPAWAFSKQPFMKNVIVSKYPLNQYLIDEEKDSLSFRDIKLTNLLYKCNEKCLNKNIVCLNNGYLMFNASESKCSCVCPPGFNGNLCEFNEQTNDSKLKCGGNITKEGTFSTPNYPSRNTAYESCSYWIIAPVNHRVEVTFDDFSFGQPLTDENKPNVDGLCLDESVEIRNMDDIYHGNIYCGEQIVPKTVMQSDDRNFIIIIIADDQMKGRGLKASVRFIKNDNQSTRQESVRKRGRKVNKRLKQNKQSDAKTVSQPNILKIVQQLGL